MPSFALSLVQLCFQSRGWANSRIDCRRPLIPKPSVAPVASFCIGAFSCCPFRKVILNTGLHSLAHSAADRLSPFASFFPCFSSS
uniref:Putative secreted protein n=1 Tax=Ixodes scapularis TaxID=6945 RepID=A0A4D5S5R5_IXOSC